MTRVCYPEKVISTRTITPRPFGRPKIARIPKLQGAFGRARPPLKNPSTAKPSTHSNPVNFIDPDGQNPILAGLAVIGIYLELNYELSGQGQADRSFAIANANETRGRRPDAGLVQGLPPALNIGMMAMALPGATRSLSGVRATPAATKSYSALSSELSGTGSQAHHVVQNAAVRDLAGYSRAEAPCVGLRGSASTIGSEHYLATRVQMWNTMGGTLGDELQIAREALFAAGKSVGWVNQAIAESEGYFTSLGHTSSTPTLPVSGRGAPRP